MQAKDARPSADRRDGAPAHPASEIQRGLHAGPRAVRAHVVVELRERRQHAFHQLAGGRVVDRLGGRPKGDAQRLQDERNAKWSYLSRAKRVRLNTTTKCTRPLFVRQNASSRCSSVRSAVFALSPLFPEALEDLQTFAAAVLLTGPELGRQAQVLPLLLRVTRM